MKLDAKDPVGVIELPTESNPVRAYLIRALDSENLRVW
jgi:hypothetical protein